MPDRIIRSGILTSDAVNALSPGAELFYRRLMSVVDDFGRYDGRPNILLAALYPLQLDRVHVVEIQDWLKECSDLILHYTVNGKPYVEIQRFGHRTRSASKWPAPADNCQQMPADVGSYAQQRARPRSDSESDSNADSYAAADSERDMPPRRLESELDDKPDYPEEDYAGIPFQQFDQLRREGFTGDEIRAAKREVENRPGFDGCARWDRYLPPIIRDLRLRGSRPAESSRGSPSQMSNSEFTKTLVADGHLEPG